MEALSLPYVSPPSGHARLPREEEGHFFLVLRYVLIMASSYLLLFDGETNVPYPVFLLIAGALGTNVALSFFEDDLLLRPFTVGAILCADIAWIALGFFLKGSFGGNIVFIYFFVLFLAATGENIILIVTAAVLLGGTDLALLRTSGEAGSVWTSSALIRIPFILTVALFYTYLADKVRRERQRALVEKELAEKLAQIVDTQTQHLRQQAEELERNYELSKVQALELQRANQVKDEFIGVMSHELRTPLSIIMGFTGMVREGLVGKVSPKQDAALESVTQAATDLLGVINTIIQVTAIESGEAGAEPEEFSLKQFLDELRLVYRTPLGKELTLQWNYPDDLPPVWLDKTKTRNILQNLIDNAIKFTEKGRVTVRARYLSVGPLVEFQVSDTGIGIPQENLPSIFEKFQQVDSSWRRVYGGVGLGLFIVKKFTDLLGGTVKLQSEPGKGSTFTVTLPCVREAQMWLSMGAKGKNS